MARIFISYPREEGGASAGRLHDRLSEHFGRDNVFIDIDTTLSPAWILSTSSSPPWPPVMS
jgi:hypothetical protein